MILYQFVPELPAPQRVPTATGGRAILTSCLTDLAGGGQAHAVGWRCVKTNSGPRGARWGRLTANGPSDVGTDAKPKPQILVEPLSQEHDPIAGQIAGAAHRRHWRPRA